MENNTDFNDAQKSHLILNDLSQNTHFPYIDLSPLPNLDTIQDLNYFPTHTHQKVDNSAFSGGVSFYEQSVDQQDVTYSSHLNQYPSSNNWSDQGREYFQASHVQAYNPYISTDVNYVPDDNDDLFSFLENIQDHSVGIYHGYNMATNTGPIELGTLAGHRPKLQCSVLECSQDREFPSESALWSHEARHSKPYVCQVPNCKHTRFGDKGGLDRHSREVHGSQTHCCPVTSCKRHVRGFPRKYNLFEHQKRCHSSPSPNLTSLSIPRQQSYTSDNMKEKQESYESGSSADMATGGGRLREKLENLYKIRAEIDLDIETLKRSLNLLGKDSP
ncbi:hypothetical protein BP6252_05210 [Coleophoma cylindrospora]|uniref:C2H2-type domain-containing protein n=1 Tax=Coleophoma cylindrospora TaxID=1849047 RepID=A0A3D8RSU3_9HELO|nr:hypothetical protein BP6252_05210 [Coleophoma cylindrospora]